MPRLWIVVALLVSPLPALAKPEVKNVQPAYGPLGPARPNDDVYPLDEYVVRYQVTGVKPDKDGRADLEITARLTGPDGKVVFDRKTPPAPRPMSLGGDAVQTFGSFTFPEKAPPGAYKLAVTVRDRTAGESASFERTLTCKPADFRIVALRFSHDADGKVPAGTTLPAGDTLHYQFKVIGFDTSRKRVGLVMRATVLAADGKDIGAKPLEVRGEVTDPDKAAGSRQATFGGLAALNRPGEFKLRIAVEDMVGKKETTFETPLKVVAP
jgi:hypothetical protein